MYESGNGDAPRSARRSPVAPDAPAALALGDEQRRIPVRGAAAGSTADRDARSRDGRAVDLNDRDLLARTSAGDTSAFTCLFERHYSPLCSFAEAFLPPSEAEEVVEDVFVRLWDRRQQIQAQSVRSYLYGATRNRALNRLRHLRARGRWLRAAAALDHAPAMGQPPPRVDERVYGAELGVAIDAAIEELPPRCREIFVLQRMHGLSYAEIAAAMDISVKTVENQIGRALRRLRERLVHLVD